jgi:hypothetical protein
VTRQADVDVRAHDAGVKTEHPGGDPADATPIGGDRPATRDELEFLDARVEETGAAVKKIKAMMKGLERSLRDAEKLHEDAKAAKKAGYDLPETQRRRVA